MKGFPWYWRHEGDAWEATLHRGGPHAHWRHEEHRSGPGGPGGPPGWGPFGRPPGGRAFGGGPFGGFPPFGFPPFGGPRRGRRWEWPPFGRGPKARRGDVRAAALLLLAEQPCNGYQIIQEIAERSDGLWKPSSGSVYPALQQLEDEGLVEMDTQEGRRTFRLTEAGRAYVEQHREELGTPWDAMKADVDDTSVELHTLLGHVAMALFQVCQAATPDQLHQARQVLIDARRSLYQILAEDEADPHD